VLGIARALGLEGTATTDFWLVLFLAGLTLLGLVGTLSGGLRLLGAVVSISVALGWVSLLTDPAFSSVLMPMRPVHVAFAAAFCLSWVVWGAVLMVPRENR
jgi:vacuolar-type H+-ATPase subunit I/STV1